jgi:membrane-bound lytic murein transglycosylase A
LPTDDRRSGAFRRLMIAQDTGSAIVGPARADIYYGAGDEAGKIAGRLRNPGMFALLMPRVLDPVVAGTAMPLPTPRPVVTAKTPAKPANGTARPPTTKPPPAPPARRGRIRWHA